MAVFKTSGANHISKEANDADVFVPAGGATTSQSLQVTKNAANIVQLASDIYGTPSLDDDGVPNLLAPLETQLVPVGTIIPFYDFNGLVTFDTDQWQYCAGDAISDAQSPLDGQNAPDLSGRYLVGFGSDGGGDLDTDGWATAAVGNSSHQIDLQHSHSVNSHTHGAGSLRFPWLHHENTLKAVGVINTWNSSGGSETELIRRNNEVTDTANNGDYYMINDFSTWDAWTENGGGLGSTGSSSPGTNNQLSSSQSIQPRSIRVRYIIRKR